jgi:hypothetical protein
MCGRFTLTEELRVVAAWGKPDGVRQRSLDKLGMTTPGRKAVRPTLIERSYRRPTTKDGALGRRALPAADGGSLGDVFGLTGVSCYDIVVPILADRCSLLFEKRSEGRIWENATVRY